jgi:hypothetical protein
MSNDDTDDELAALRESTDPGTRTATKVESGEADEFVTDLKEAVAEKQQKGAQRSVSIWDANIAGLLDALDRHPDRLEESVSQLADDLGRDVDPDSYDRSELLRLLILLGLQEGAPELEDKWRTAVGELAKEQL